MNTMVTPIRKLSASKWPNSMADMTLLKAMPLVVGYLLRGMSDSLKRQRTRLHLARRIGA